MGWEGVDGDVCPRIANKFCDGLVTWRGWGECCCGVMSHIVGVHCVSFLS